MRELYYRNYKNLLTTSDLFYAPIYALLLLIFFAFIKNLLYRSDNPIRKYFIPALLVKMIGAVAIGIVYSQYYGGGDTNEFWNNALVFNIAFTDDPRNFWLLLNFEPAKNIIIPAEIQEYVWWSYFVTDPASFYVGKITGVVNLLTFNIYTACALIFAALSFTGLWALYVTFCDIYPKLYKQLAIAVLFVPSVFFWGSGILKDSITLGSVGWMTFFSYNIFFKKRHVFWGWVGLIIASYLIFRIKPYILYAFVPSLFLWLFLFYRSSIKSAFVRTLAGPVVYSIAFATGLVAIRKLGQEFINRAEVFQTWHGTLEKMGEVGSAYSLGTLDGSLWGTLSKVPAAINVTLFRPYLWEVTSPMVALSALESTIMLFFTIRIIYKTGLVLTLKSLINNPTAFFCIFFAMFFGFCVGFTAYNFGALVRYKIPCIPFYVAGLYILRYQIEIEQEKKKELERKGYIV